VDAGRLDRAHPLHRDAQLRSARHGEPAGLSRPARHQAGLSGRRPKRRFARRWNLAGSTRHPRSRDYRDFPTPAATASRSTRRDYGGRGLNPAAGRMPSRPLPHGPRFQVLADGIVAPPRASAARGAFDYAVAANPPGTRDGALHVAHRDGRRSPTACGTGLPRRGRGGHFAGGISHAHGVQPSRTVTALVLTNIGPYNSSPGPGASEDLHRAQPLPQRIGAMRYASSAVCTARSFPALDDRDWDDLARLHVCRAERQSGGDYDPRLADTLPLDVEHPAPGIWNEFRALGGRAILSIPRANSDILSAETQSANERRAPTHGDRPGAGRRPPATGYARVPLLPRIAGFHRRERGPPFIAPVSSDHPATMSRRLARRARPRRRPIASAGRLRSADLVIRFRRARQHDRLANPVVIFDPLGNDSWRFRSSGLPPASRPRSWLK